MQISAYLIDPFTLPASADGMSLAGWYAEPLEEARAQALLEQAQRNIRHAYADGTSAFGGLLQLMLARFRSGRGIDQEADSLLATSAQARERALIELVRGQLLLSVRRSDATPHLDAGFRLAANLLSPEDYFTVLKRHEWLHALPLYPQPQGPQGLRQLLTEAVVIRRLRGSRGERPRSTEGAHLDTLD